MTAFPRKVRIVEVGPRDGLQNQPRVVPTAAKAEFVRLLAAAGFGDIEVTSFVRTDRVPQLADAEALLAELGPGGRARYSALVPNKKGLERAISSGIPRVAVLTAAWETFNRRNINMGIRESIDQLGPIVRRARQDGMSVRGYVSTCWVCPYEGAVDPDAVVGIVGDLLALGIDEISVGDTVGAATPRDVEATVGRLLGRFPAERLAMHFHDTYGTAVANAYQALRMGLATFDSSAGGLGGCPYAPGALGNVATEDLLYLFDRLGIETGVSLAKVRRASEHIARVLDRRLPSRVLATAAGRETEDF